MTKHLTVDLDDSAPIYEIVEALETDPEGQLYVAWQKKANEFINDLRSNGVRVAICYLPDLGLVRVQMYYKSSGTFWQDFNPSKMDNPMKVFQWLEIQAKRVGWEGRILDRLPYSP